MTEPNLPSHYQPIPIKPRHLIRSIIITVSILMVLGGAVVYLVWRSAGRHIGEFQASVDENFNSNQRSNLGSDYLSLIGTWETSCLTPDANKSSVEKYQYIFTADGAAHRTHWSGNSCANLTTTTKDDYVVSLPSSGNINFISNSVTIYDIYSITGDVLLFGQGFCNCSSDNSNLGASESTRFQSLNTYLVYHRGS